MSYPYVTDRVCRRPVCLASNHLRPYILSRSHAPREYKSLIHPNIHSRMSPMATPRSRSLPLDTSCLVHRRPTLSYCTGPIRMASYARCIDRTISFQVIQFIIHTARHRAQMGTLPGRSKKGQQTQPPSRNPSKQKRQIRRAGLCVCSSVFRDLPNRYLTPSTYHDSLGCETYFTRFRPRAHRDSIVAARTYLDRHGRPTRVYQNEFNRTETWQHNLCNVKHLTSKLGLTRYHTYMYHVSTPGRRLPRCVCNKTVSLTPTCFFPAIINRIKIRYGPGESGLALVRI